jgi:hypothetical protein
LVFVVMPLGIWLEALGERTLFSPL